MVGVCLLATLASAEVIAPATRRELAQRVEREDHALAAYLREGLPPEEESGAID